MFMSPVAKTPGNDKGYTLVELIVVISIMAVMVGLLSFGVSVMFSKDADSVARTIDDQLAEVRMAAMSKPGTFSIIIHTTSTGSGNYIEIEKSELDLVVPTPTPVGYTPTPDPTPTSETTRVDFDNDATIVFGIHGTPLPATASDGTIIISFDN